ncbi:MAG: hypothetical protein EOP82_13125 [Variovorax sp.]|nr:MAG: hypothetical protein EOP82_13125 [Variovorax sp.]
MANSQGHAGSNPECQRGEEDKRVLKRSRASAFISMWTSSRIGRTARRIAAALNRSVVASGALIDAGIPHGEDRAHRLRAAKPAGVQDDEVDQRTDR